jgi:hypothetical protein
VWFRPETHQAFTCGRKKARDHSDKEKCRFHPWAFESESSPGCGAKGYVLADVVAARPTAIETTDWHASRLYFSATCRSGATKEQRLR